MQEFLKRIFGLEEPKPKRECHIVTVGLEAALQRLYEIALRRQGWTVAHCSSIADTVLAAKSHRPSFIVVDDHIPLESLREQLEADLDTAGIPLKSEEFQSMLDRRDYRDGDDPGGSAAAVITPLDR